MTGRKKLIPNVCIALTGTKLVQKLISKVKRGDQRPQKAAKRSIKAVLSTFNMIGRKNSF
jgi:hypothetical protein